VAISHLGKNDPPRRWSGSDESAASQILGAAESPNWTFLRDAKAGLDFTIELQRDSRWEHDTVSLTGVPEERVQQVAHAIARCVPYFVAIVGVVGGGKDQAWKVLCLSPDCPDSLRRQFTDSKPPASSDGGRDRCL
jgi:hypothetical protein